MEPAWRCSPWAAGHSAQGLTGWSFHIVGQCVSYSGSEAGRAKEHAYAKKTAQGEWMAGKVCRWRGEGAWAWADTASRMDGFSEILANALGAQDPGRPGDLVLQKQAPRPGERPPLLVPAARQSPPARTSPPQGRLANQELVNCASDWFASSSHRLMFQELETQLRVKRVSTQSRESHFKTAGEREREKKVFLE